MNCCQFWMPTSIYLAGAAGDEPTTATAWRFEFQTRQNAVNQQIFGFGKALPPLLWTFLKLYHEQYAMARDLIAGRTPLAAHSDMHRQLLSWCGELLAKHWETLVAAEPKEQGYLMGRAIFEVASLLIPAAKAGALPQLTTLEFLNSLKAQSAFFQSGGKGAAAMQAVEEGTAEIPSLVSRLQKVAAGCFVAGTPVWTREGWQPVETIRRGNLVLARDERTGGQDWKPVVTTTVSHPAALVHVRSAALVRHSREGDGNQSADEDWIEDELVSTVEHPFWVAEGAEGRFVAAQELSAGSRLSLAGGGEAVVAGSVLWIAPLR